MDKCKVLLDVDSVEFKDRKKLNRMKILLQQPTFDCDPYKEGDLKEVTPGEGEECQKSFLLVKYGSSASVGAEPCSDPTGSGDDAAKSTEPKRRPLRHQRSISLISEASSCENLSLERNEEENLSRRPRGMSLPFASNDELQNVQKRRRGTSFFPGNNSDFLGLGSFYNQLQNISVPTISFDAISGNAAGRKISFALRKLSQTNLNKSDSMVSLSYRPLANYISEENLVGLRNFLDNRKPQVDDRDENQSTALIYAATKGKYEFVKELIKFGADVNAEDGDNWTALLCAAKEGYLDICRELLDQGASVDHRDMGGWTALLWASYKGHYQIAELLVENGADVNAHENYHICAIHWACGRGHSSIVKLLLQNGAKVNVGDKYGTTALIWACRKGKAEIVEMLLKAGANADTSGMYSWTPLIVAAAGNHVEVVNLLLEHKPNVNALDKDGYAALALACKEGYYDIVVALLSAGAYINIQDRSGDTNLILAVKGGHRNVVEALLKKYADVDTPGKDKKTALYTAVEKGNASLVKLLLSANPDLEVTTKDGDCALLRAVRSRNAEIVQLLLDKKAKVSVADKKGDTALHIAMRARSKAIVEILLRNPKNSQLLYRPNRNGETPYNIDINQQKTILGQIFGARRLNTNEDNENMLGYDLYSSALADILSEPSLSMPITVGLYAKWGSGKSFLLNKLKEEMKNFARQWVDPSLKLSSLLIVTVFHITLLLAVIVTLVSSSWLAGVITLIVSFFLMFTFLLILWCCGKRSLISRLHLRYDWSWPYQASVYLARRMNFCRLILQVVFCHPPGSQCHDSRVQPIRFNFTDQTRISSTTGGENSVVVMLGTLYDSIERDYGSLSTRMDSYLSDTTLKILLITIGTLLAIGLVANVYTLGNLFAALIFSQRRHLQRSIARLESLKSEGFLQALKGEVTLMTEMVHCLDSFTKQQTRLVIIVNGLDSCEQDIVLMVLDAIHILFSDVNSPFIVILAIDPHIISKAVELNSRKLISETSIGGHEYLRNMVHLPFFLANSALRKVKIAQNAASKRSNMMSYEAGDEFSARRLSSESTFNSSMEKLKLPSKRSSRKLKSSESVASSIGSNLNKIGGAQDLTKMLLTDDYFSDVNPRSMRRLLNVVYVTGRLLKAFQMDFNWYHLAVWINITEQWPYRTSWLIWFYELHEDTLDDQTSLKSIYDEVRPKIPINKEIEPLLERDRDERKFDIFLTYHRTNLLLSDLKIFLPFTINLDPYIKKVIKEDSQDGRWGGSPFIVNTRSSKSQWLKTNDWTVPKENIRVPIPRSGTYGPSSTYPQVICQDCQSCMVRHSMGPGILAPAPMSATTSLPAEIFEPRLSHKTVEGVCELVERMPEIDANSASQYISVIKKNNISGKVLLHCDLSELKKVLEMNFGDWEMFKVMIISLREHELSCVSQAEEIGAKNVRFHILKDKKQQSSEKVRDQEKESRRLSSKPSAMESQVTLEDQMICGALQTLNEEACEDVLEESGDIGEFSRKKEKLTNAVAHYPHELSESKSLVYLKSCDLLPRGSESSSSFTLHSAPGTNLQDTNRKESKSDSNSIDEHSLKNGLSPSALHVLREKKASPSGSVVPEPSTSSKDQSSNLLSIPYKENVVHVQTQTPSYPTEKRAKKVGSMRPDPGNGGTRPENSNSPNLPHPQHPSGGNDRSSNADSNNYKSGNETKEKDISDSEIFSQSENSSIQIIFGDDESGSSNRKDTSVVFYQSSCLSQPNWQTAVVNVGEEFSPVNSECGTPIQQRNSLVNRWISHHGSIKSTKESLRVPESPFEIKLNDELILDVGPIAPKSCGNGSPGPDGDSNRGKSLFRFPSFIRKRSVEATEESSKSKDNTQAKREIMVLDSFDRPMGGHCDESTPLVGSLKNSGSERCLNYNLTVTKNDSLNRDADNSTSKSLPNIPKMFCFCYFDKKAEKAENENLN
ncbi:hypothetical protein RUM44_008169 [Polyplax serrata]|uniref:KAP NTPase domain-containing protein n=1 Tax=Polyplax serrata TaxID=468196 RepID=A0ABR1BBI8_POLSC